MSLSPLIFSRLNLIFTEFSSSFFLFRVLYGLWSIWLSLDNIQGVEHNCFFLSFGNWSDRSFPFSLCNSPCPFFSLPFPQISNENSSYSIGSYLTTSNFSNFLIKYFTNYFANSSTISNLGNELRFFFHLDRSGTISLRRRLQFQRSYFGYFFSFFQFLGIIFAKFCLNFNLVNIAGRGSLKVNYFLTIIFLGKDWVLWENFLSFFF